MIPLLRASNKYRFYDLVRQARLPHQSLSQPSSSPSTSTSTGLSAKDLAMKKARVSEIQRNAIEGNYKLAPLSPEERIQQVFGGRIRGDDRQSLSRINVGKPRVIAGVKVPARPVEPDNCCMSGCINCVWEIFNDDVKEWNQARQTAAQKLAQRGGTWPADFDPPVKFLDPANVPAELRAAPSELEAWDKVPVQIRVFAEIEKKLKAKKAGKAVLETDR